MNELSLTPAVFVGHGNPLNALETNRYTNAWSEFASSFPRPRAIVVISAHWYINATAVTAMSVPRTIHDFYGFPQELFDVEYPAPGAPDVAAHVSDIVKPTWVGLDHDSWGIDHGTWSVLIHMYPQADVPVIQLSVNATKSLDYHVGLGAQLHELRREGVLVVASGNVVHNLRLIEWSLQGQGTDWAQRFDDSIRDTMTSDVSRLGASVDHRDFPLAVPTPDHFLPLAYLAGLAGVANEPVRTFIEGYEFGSLSMTGYRLD